MNVSELLDAAIEEIGRVLIGNKDRNTEEVYLKNAIRHIREYGSQPQLNSNQQIVLDYLKDKCNLYSFIAYKPFEAIIRLSMLDPEKNELRVKNTIDELTYKQQAQVLEVFSRWALEQEEE